MISKKMMQLGKKRSAIRETFEYSKIREQQIGKENVFDFSIGNPSVPAPDCITQTLIDLLKNSNPVELHGYTSAQGDLASRKAVADFIDKTQHAYLDPNYIYLTVGASAALSATFHAISVPDDEIILFAPYFAEYSVFIDSAGAKLVSCPSHSDTLLPDFDALEKLITAHTKAVVVNSPNNPTGVVYPSKTIQQLADILVRKEKEFDSQIFIVSDEPYRELVYDNTVVPYIPAYYTDTIVCYSFSKIWSLPGERIGYVALTPNMRSIDDIYAAICGAGRYLGYICAPSMYQKLMPLCMGATSDIKVYEQNRNILYDALTQYGFSCVHPDGAFYLFVKSPESDANKFCQKAKEFELLLVASNSFGYPGFVRISYCKTTQQILNSLPAFEKLAKSYNLK
ncbi:MAG: pyridoxal phosphate-dependent aminotransferase [Clostridia bacterium]